MTKDPTVELSDWMQPATMDCEALQAYGMMILFWPSGQRTIAYYCSTVVIHGSERRRYQNPESRQSKLDNLFTSMREFRRIIHPPGWYIKTDRRGHKHGRRIRSIAFIHPRSYDGPAPVIGDRI